MLKKEEIDGLRAIVGDAEIYYENFHKDDIEFLRFCVAEVKKILDREENLLDEKVYN